MVYITRKEHFNAAHRLFNPKWTKEKNKEVFKECASENWHGHNFELWVTVKGNPDNDTGQVMDLKALGKLVNKLIIEKVDHKNLNLDVDFLKDTITSCENLVIIFWKILNSEIKKFPNVMLHCIKLVETPKHFVEYYGE